MKTTYNGIDIAYDEADNCWHFTLRGRERVAGSLAKAKEAIDKEPKDKRAQTFPRFDAYYFRFSRETEVVSVTSVAGAGYLGGLYFWVKSAQGERSKVSASELFPVGERNSAIMDTIKRLNEHIRQLEAEKRANHSKLEAATLPKELA